MLADKYCIHHHLTWTTACIYCVMYYNRCYCLRYYHHFYTRWNCSISMCILFPFTLLNVFPAVLEMKMRVKICNLSIFMNDRTFLQLNTFLLERFTRGPMKCCRREECCYCFLVSSTKFARGKKFTQQII